MSDVVMPLGEGQIRSRNPMFKGMPIDPPRPPTARLTLPGEDDEALKCPWCGAMVTIDECDCIGAEPDCVFCSNCNRELQL